MAVLTQHLAGNLKRLRHTRELTQSELAARAGLQQQYISNLERGLRPARTAHLDRLARALDVDILELLGLAVPEAQGQNNNADNAPHSITAARVADAVRS